MALPISDPAGSRSRSPASGGGELVAQRVGGRTVLSIARASSPLRFIQPTFPGSSAAYVCLVTFGGGLVDGDAIDLSVVVEPGATLVLFTQSSTKAFRGASRQSIRAHVEGTLIALPDPVSAFGDARYTQRVDVALTGSGSCVLLDGVTSGRPAYGERWAMRALDLRSTVVHDGRVLVHDGLRLEAGSRPIGARLGASDALSTILAFGASVAPVARGIIEGAEEEVAVRAAHRPAVVVASEVPRARDLAIPSAVARVMGHSPADALACVRACLRNLPDIDVVDPYASRH